MQIKEKYFESYIAPFVIKKYFTFDQVSCEAGKECYIDENTGEGKCECIKECGYEPDPRRKVVVSKFHIRF